MNPEVITSQNLTENGQVSSSLMTTEGEPDSFVQVDNRQWNLRDIVLKSTWPSSLHHVLAHMQSIESFLLM
jgi:hypothetical protein